MADKVRDAGNNKQFFICFHLIENLLEVNEDFIGLYQVNNIKAESWVKAIEDALLRLSIPLKNARGQKYDGGNNMVGVKFVTATQILKKSPKVTFLIHCFAHALNLSVGGMMRHVPFLDNIMSTTPEISNLTNLSPKRAYKLTSLTTCFINYNPGQNIWNKVKKSSKTGQE